MDENQVYSRDSSMLRILEKKELGKKAQLSAVNSGTSGEDQNKLRQSDQMAPNGSLLHALPEKVHGMASIPTFLDERSLLACLVRAIPSEASAHIKISTTVRSLDVIVYNTYKVLVI